jgi:NAD-dependent deacetylase
MYKSRSWKNNKKAGDFSMERKRQDAIDGDVAVIGDKSREGLKRIDSGIIQALRAASRVVVFTGAGVSAESGIPTFRDKQTGLWENFDAAELATPHAFERDPAFVWGWYEWRRAMVLTAQPNAGHLAIAAMAEYAPHFTLITQNVDDLHERAGSRDVTHLHGELSRPYCEACRRPYDHSEGIPVLPPEGTRLPPPLCLMCGAKIRPGVVWFGEQLPQDQWDEAREAATCCDYFICCGTSALVQPAASLTNIAIDAGATTLQINPNPTDVDASVTYSIKGSSGTTLPQLLAETWNAL